MANTQARPVDTTASVRAQPTSAPMPYPAKAMLTPTMPLITPAIVEERMNSRKWSSRRSMSFGTPSTPLTRKSSDRIRSGVSASGVLKKSAMNPALSATIAAIAAPMRALAVSAEAT